MSDHRRWDDDVAAFLLGALEEDEREAFERHLLTCAACREEVEFLRVGAEALPASVPQLEPPPELRDRIMRVVRSEAELLAAAGPEADRVPVPRRRRRFALAWAAPLSAAAAAAVLAIVVLGGGGDVRTVNASLAPAAARVSLDIRDEHATLVAERLPAPPRGRIYQVWLKRPGRDPEPTRSLFRPSDRGTVSVDIPGSLEGVEGVLVTDEPLGGSQVPTREPVIALSPA